MTAAAPTFCPATMCPLFARDGSPWTGEKNGPCPQHDDIDFARSDVRCGCVWWGFGGGRCGGVASAFENLVDVECRGWTPQAGQIHPEISHQKRGPAAPRAYDCPRALDCQWQVQCGAELCPPRAALAKGLDPKIAAF